MRYRFLRFPGGKEKAVTLSYDDGVKEDLRLSDVITEHGIKCTFNLNSSKFYSDAYVTENDVKEYFLDRGHEIAVHGAYHRAEGALRPIEGIKEVLDCRLELEKRFDIIIRGMAYPDSGIGRLVNGVTYESIKSYLTELDIAYSRTLGGDNNSFELPADWHAWMPTAHHNNPKIMEYIDEFLKIDAANGYVAAGRPRLFYIWGHSYEFKNNNNWEHLDEICSKLGGKDDIWYATNMEIYNYVQAYNSLVYSADGNTIYNPTLYTIWMSVDKEIYKIGSGETIKL